MKCYSEEMMPPYSTYIRQNVGPDDIYAFSTQMFMMAALFLRELSFVADIEYKMKESEAFDASARMIASIAISAEELLGETNQDIAK